MDGEQDDIRALLEARYGVAPSTSTRRWRRIAVAAAVTVLLVAFLVLAISGRGEQVHTEDVAFRMVDDTTVEVTFAVYQDAGSSAECTVVVLNDSFAEVGVTRLTVGPVADEATVVTARVTTAEPAAGARVTGCRPVDAPVS